MLYQWMFVTNVGDSREGSSISIWQVKDLKDLEAEQLLQLMKNNPTLEQFQNQNRKRNTLWATTWDFEFSNNITNSKQK